VLVGSNDPIDMDAVSSALQARGGSEIGLSGAELAGFVDGADPLIDDYAPVDQMLTGL
jgi:hypothetical protein